jgi:hypothetical protein
MSPLGQAALLSVLVASIAAFSQTRREDELPCDEKSAAKTEIARADATILGLTIGRSSLSDVQKRLGRSKIARVSRDEESDDFVCHVSPTDGTVLVFYTGGLWEAVQTLRGSRFGRVKLVSRSLRNAHLRSLCRGASLRIADYA